MRSPWAAAVLKYDLVLLIWCFVDGGISSCRVNVPGRPTTYYSHCLCFFRPTKIPANSPYGGGVGRVRDRVLKTATARRPRRVGRVAASGRHLRGGSPRLGTAARPGLVEGRPRRLVAHLVVVDVRARRRLARLVETAQVAVPKGRPARPGVVAAPGVNKTVADKRPAVGLRPLRLDKVAGRPPEKDADGPAFGVATPVTVVDVREATAVAPGVPPRLSGRRGPRHIGRPVVARVGPAPNKVERVDDGRVRPILEGPGRVVRLDARQVMRTGRAPRVVGRAGHVSRRHALVVTRPTVTRPFLDAKRLGHPSGTAAVTTGLSAYAGWAAVGVVRAPDGADPPYRAVGVAPGCLPNSTYKHIFLAGRP